MSRQLGDLLLSDSVLTDIDFSNPMHGDLSVIGGTVYVRDGNYMQADDSENVKNYSYRNSFLQAEYVSQHPEWGIACTGSKGYCMLAIYPDLSAVKLSGDLTDLKNATCRKMSWRIGASGGDEDLEVLSVSGSTVVFRGMPDSLASLSGMTYDELSALYDAGDNKFFCAVQPQVSGYWITEITPSADSVKLAGTGMAALTDAIYRKFSYALEGECDSEVLTISAVDATQHIAYFDHALPNGIASLSSKPEIYMKLLFELDDNALYYPKDPTLGNTIIHNFYANHAEGGSVKAIGKYTHAEGRRTIADNRYSHAEGDGSFAGRMAAHAEGS